MSFHTFRDILDMIVIAAPANDRTVVKQRQRRLICQYKVLYFSLNLIRNCVKSRRPLRKWEQLAVLCQRKAGLDIRFTNFTFSSFALEATISTVFSFPHFTMLPSSRTAIDT